MIPTWLVLGALGAVGLVLLLAGMWAAKRDADEGARRISSGIGLLGGALVMAIAKAIKSYGQMRGWW